MGNLNSDDLTNLIKKRLSFKYKFEELKSLPSKITATELLAEDFKSEQDELSQPAFMQQSKSIGSKRGSAMHQFMSYADLSAACKDLDGEINFLLEKEILTNEQADVLERKYIHKFFNSNLYKRIINSDKLFREYKFSVELPLNKIYDISNENLKNEVLVLQGAVDCVFIEAGEAIIVDYKTDHSKDEGALEQRYRKQLDLYALAIEKCFGLKVKEKIIYSFYTASEIQIKNF